MLHDRVFFPAYLAAIARGADLAALAPQLEQALDQRRASGNRFGEVHVLTLMAWQQLRLGDNKQAAVMLATETGYMHIVGYIPDLRPLLAEIEQRPASMAQHSLTQDDAIRLTDQEQRVLTLLAADLTYSQIADALTISINTVRAHVRNLYRKLPANRRMQAIETARQRGLLDRHESVRN